MTQQSFDKNFSTKGPENYEKYFVPVIGKPLAEDLVKIANFSPGEKVLDVACGTGIIARLAREKVKPNGSVEGLDVNPGMLALARSINKNTSSEWYEANAEAMPLADNLYDVVICQMGLQFMEDKVVALKEMKRVLKQDGRLLFNLPGPIAEPFIEMAKAMESNINAKAAGFVQCVFALYNKEKIDHMLKEAGFTNIEIRTNTRTLHLPPAADFLWQYIYSTPLAPVVLEANKQAHQNLENDLIARWQKFRKNGNIILEQPMVTVIARK